MMINRQVLTVLFCLVVQAVFGQEGEQCNCGEIAQKHEKCVQDWSILDELRRTLEQQIRDTESQANERCNAQVEQVRGEVNAQIEQVRGEGQAQVEQARNEGNARLELVRSESQAQLQQVETEKESELKVWQDKAQADLSQCQTQQQELNSQFEKQGKTQRALQESAQELENTLSSAKSEKSKLEKKLSETDLAFSKAKKEKKEIKRELDDVKKLLDDTIAAKGIVNIDWDLLGKRIEENKVHVQEHFKEVIEFVGKYLQMAKDKAMEFYDYVMTEIYPQVEQFVVNDVIPFCENSWKQAKALWEDVYGPYRPTVDKEVGVAKKEWKKFYAANLEPSVKEYKLDEHAATAKKNVEDNAALAHKHLVDGIKTGTGVAHNFAKLEEGPDFVIEGLGYLHTNHEKIVFGIEGLLALFVLRFILRMTIWRPKKKVTKAAKKEQWKQKQGGVNGKQQPAINKKNVKNGQKNSKKNK